MNFADFRILVVEDDEFQRKALVILLEELEVQHLQATDDGRSGLDVFVNSIPPVDIIITDLNMPGMDGIEFIRRIGETGTPVSIVLASAVDNAVLASVENVAAAYGLTLLGSIQKPIRTEHLESLLGKFKPHGLALPKGVAKKSTIPVEEIVDALREAQFEPYFQPKVEFQTGRIRGFEALARWRRRDLTVVAPGAFVPLMEAHGLIGQLTIAMLRKSAAACRTWRDEGHDFCVSVNISVQSLASLQFADELVAIVQEEKLDPRYVILEVTESATATSELSFVLDNLSRLRLKGFGLSLDDYGTGYSSLQQLSRIAFTELKVDQSFVRNASKNESGLAILQSSLDVAKMLKIVSVAEGIETGHDWKMLREMGCDLAQGYFVARPMPAADVLSWSSKWHDSFAALVPPALQR